MRDMDEGDDDLLRWYLLGEVSEEEENRLEERLFQDDQLFQQAEVVEGDLLAEYARGELTTAQRSEILRRWSASETGRARLALAQGLARISEEQGEVQPVAAVIPFKEPVPAKQPAWHRWVAALAAGLVLFVVTPLAIRTARDNGAEAPVMVGKMPRTPTPGPSATPSQPQPPSIGTPPPGANPSEPPSQQAQASPAPVPEEVQVAVVSLAFVGMQRGENTPPAVLYVPRDAREVEFEVPLAAPAEDSYRVSFKNVGTGKEVVQGEDLQPVSLTASEQGLRFKVTAERVPEGRYHLEVRGVTAAGMNPIPEMDQDFEIRKK